MIEPAADQGIDQVVALGIYEHYSGKRYQVLGVAQHTETSETVIVYRSLYGDFALWVRPKSMFLEHIEKNGQLIPRFKLVSNA